MSKLSDGLTAYLKSWHETTVENKTEAGHIVDLPFEDFIGLFKRSHFVSLQKAIDANRLRYMQDVGNAYALVATWRSYAACSSGVYNKDTATICSRTKSAKINLPQAGDKLRPSHCHNISASLIGKEKAPEHRKAISNGCRGVSKAAWSPERRAQRSAQRQAQEAAKKESTMTNMNVDDLIAALGPRYQENLKRITESKSQTVAPENTNNGKYAALDDSFHDAEPVEQAAPAPKFTGRISQSVHVEKGCELSVWRNGNEVKVEVRNFLGQTAYGKMSGVMGAEGGFGPPVDDEDKAFTDKVFEIVVGPERKKKADANNFNYSKRATCLWMNRDFNGLPVAHSFLIIDWGSFSNGAQYAKEAILFDGDRVFSFPLQKQSVTSTSHPQWKGRCS